MQQLPTWAADTTRMPAAVTAYSWGTSKVVLPPAQSTLPPIQGAL